MATLTNVEKAMRGLSYLLDGIKPWVDMRMKAQVPAGQDWVAVQEATDTQKFGQQKSYDRDDVRFLLRMIVENRQVFKQDLSHAQFALVSELKDSANAAHHVGAKKLSSDDTYRMLDTTERLLNAIGAPEEASAVGELRLSHQREVFEKQVRNLTRERSTAVTVGGTVAGTAIKPWREVITPHSDVLNGKFSASEFAADLHAVATGAVDDALEYTDPVQFFRRTYLTGGLSELLRRALQRLGGEAGSPVVNLQTQFGGGKTHSMLALYHLFSGTPSSAMPQSVQDLVHDALPDGSPSDTTDPLGGLDVLRVALVGTWLAKGQADTTDGRPGIRTLWGELAWQLAGQKGFDRVAESDANSMPPGPALTELVRDLVADGKKILILIDEWVAYARTLVGQENQPGGSFENQFTFAQHLTELAKTTPGMMLVVSIPASDSLDNGGGGSALEVGGPNGMAALERLQQVVGRTADDWRPANNVESFEIVRRRLFEDPDPAALTDIAAIAKQYSKYYRDNTGMFPKDVLTSEYERRMRAAYPVHPELFDRLYEDWSTLPKFQRTRGVLQLMSRVIHALWVGDDRSPLITPGSLPIGTSEVLSEVTKYVDDTWKTVVDKDVDGTTSTPVAIDTERPSFGNRALTRRVARTVFVGSVGTKGAAHHGVDKLHLRLGAAVPGDTVSHIGDARELLGQRATYFYEDGDRYWYDTAASVTRTANERAAGYSEADVFAAIEDLLRAQQKQPKGLFATVHGAVAETGDVPDGDVLRLALLHPKYSWTKGDSPALEFARALLKESGRSQRRSRNMLVMLAADRSRLAELDGVVREHKAWASILRDPEALGLSMAQVKQVETRVAQLQDAVANRFRTTWTALLVPQQGTDGAADVAFTRLGDRGNTLAERATARLQADGAINATYATNVLHIALSQKLDRAWETGHIRFGDLWSWYTEYPYLPRLTGRDVLERAVLDVDNLPTWQSEGFALAAGYDETVERYEGLWLPGDVPEPATLSDDWLLVRPERAIAQRAAETRDAPEPGPSDPEVPSPTVDPTTVTPSTSPTPRTVVKRRYFGVKHLDPVSYTRDWNLLREEIVSALTAVPGTSVEITVDIQASNDDGFPEHTVRTVNENATTLGLKPSSFEEM